MFPNDTAIKVVLCYQNYIIRNKLQEYEYKQWVNLKKSKRDHIYRYCNVPIITK